MTTVWQLLLLMAKCSLRHFSHVTKHMIWLIKPYKLILKSNFFSHNLKSKHKTKKITQQRNNKKFSNKMTSNNKAKNSVNNKYQKCYKNFLIKSSLKANMKFQESQQWNSSDYLTADNKFISTDAHIKVSYNIVRI